MGSGHQPERNLDRDAATVFARFEVWKRLALVPIIASFWIPLRAVEPIARDFAGRHTVVSFAFGVNITISLILGGTLLAQLEKIRRQRRELQRQRERIHELEARLSALGAGQSGTP